MLTLDALLRLLSDDALLEEVEDELALDPATVLLEDEDRLTNTVDEDEDVDSEDPEVEDHELLEVLEDDVLELDQLSTTVDSVLAELGVESELVDRLDELENELTLWVVLELEEVPGFSEDDEDEDRESWAVEVLLLLVDRLDQEEVEVLEVEDDEDTDDKDDTDWLLVLLEDSSVSPWNPSSKI